MFSFSYYSRCCEKGKEQHLFWEKLCHLNMGQVYLHLKWPPLKEKKLQITLVGFRQL